MDCPGEFWVRVLVRDAEERGGGFAETEGVRGSPQVPQKRADSGFGVAHRLQFVKDTEAPCRIRAARPAGSL